ncbi:MAG: hypothetical protein EXR73_12765 [Myxococcales bacterium]|nr:hypothetical protein [Myxococcales bacterium]
MTSSATPTSPGWRRARGLLVFAAAAGVPVLLALYGWRPTPAAPLLLVVWWALLVALALLVRAALAIGVVENESPVAATAARRLELELEKRHILKAIKEVEFDQAMGKLDDTDAAAIIGRYRARGREVLRALDESGTQDDADGKGAP